VHVATKLKGADVSAAGVAMAVLCGAVLAYGLWSVPTAVSAGDAPESVVGVESWGVLHAPGYALYVLVAGVFARVVAIGDLAWRVNLFSAAATAVAAGCLWWIARRLGASALGAALGALGWATAASVWFYAGFAKHNSFTAAGIAVLWAGTLIGRSEHDRSMWLRAGACGLVTGLLVGALWPAVAVATPTTAMLLIWRHPRRWAATVAAFTAATAGGAAAVIGWVLWRASSDPASNWGRVDSPQRLWELLTLADFGWGREAATATPADETTGWLFGDLFANLGRYIVVLALDLGPVIFVLAAAGVYVAWRHLPRLPVAALSAGILVNLVVLAVALGITLRGIESALAQNGFLASALLATAVFAAIGATRLEQRLSARTPQLGPWALVLLAAITITGAALTHPAADHSPTPFADTYAQDVFADLPDNAVLLVWGAERAFPLWQHQQVRGERRDVTVVAADGLNRPWYREQLRERDGLPLQRESSGSEADEAQRLTERLESGPQPRPVFLDMAAASTFEAIDSTPIGLVATADEQPVDPVALTAHIETLLNTPGITDGPGRLRWPYQRIATAYASAAAQAAQACLQEGRGDLARSNIDLALEAQPNNPVVRTLHEAIHQQSAQGPTAG
jgi:hypothetical protein